MMRLLALLPILICSRLVMAAEPDWNTLDKAAIDLLQRYIRVASINPPANMGPATALLRTELEKYGFQTTVYQSGAEGQANLLVRMPGRDRSKKPLLLLSHMDVVPVDRKAWSIDPFGGEIRDGSIWGRGALDMKGLGVQQLMALVALKQAGITPSRDILLLCSADEETGGTLGVRWMLEKHGSEIDAEYVLDEGGFGTRDVFSNNQLVFGVAIAEKQLLWLRIRARGTAAHGSQPIPDNANLTLLRAVEKALDLPATSKLNDVVRMMRDNVGELATNKFTAAIQRNTASLTTLRSGVGDPPKVNVIPSTGEATLDCRLLPGVNADEFISEMKARINDPRVTVELVQRSEDPGASSPETPLFAALRKAILKHHPSATVTPMLVPYGTDSAKLRQRRIPAYGFIPMVLDAKTLATMHSDEERIPVDEFLKGLHIYFDVLRSEF